MEKIKQAMKRTLAMLMVVIMLICAAPLDGFVGLKGFSFYEMFVSKVGAINVTEAQDALVEYFYEMATIKWTAGADFKVAVGKGSQTYYKGKTYYGLPYAQKGGSSALTVEMYQKEMDKNSGKVSKFIGQSDCSTSLGVVFKKVFPKMKMLWSPSEFTKKANGFNKVGTVGDYSSLQAGDVLVNSTKGHVMMVVSVNKTKKTVRVIHQSSGYFTFNPAKDTTGNSQTSMSKRNCSWGVNQDKAYSTLKTGGYQGYRYKDLGNPTTQVSTPKLSTTNYYGGVNVKLTTATNGATIYYTTNGSNPTTSSTKYTGEFALTGTKTVKAVAVKSGMSDSTVMSKSVTVNKTNTPTIESNVSAYGFNIILEGEKGADIYYSLDGSTPTFISEKYNGQFVVDESVTVKAIAVVNGKAVSSVATSNISAEKSEAPIVKLESSKTCGIGDTISVSWNNVKNAGEYRAVMLCDGKEIGSLTTGGTMASFAAEAVGKNEIYVVSKNFLGDSEKSASVFVDVKADLTVTFTDDDGTILSKQKVKYGGNAVAPVQPAKTGHTFKSWKGSYQNVTQDTTILATYTPNQYTVTFVDAEGKTLVSESVDYGKSFDESRIPVITAPTGYKFVAWSVKSGDGDSYKKVNGDVTFEPTFAWINPDMPVAVSITKAIRTNDSKGYNVEIKITNTTNSDVDGKIIAVTKTSADKLVATEIESVNIKANATDTEKQIYIGSTKDAKTVEVYIVANDPENNDRTGGAYSEKVTAEVMREATSEVSYWGEWSDWSTTPVEATETRNVETKTQYSYSDKQTTTNTASSLSGWTKTGSSVKYGSWGSWSSWSTTKQTKSQTKDVQTRTVYKYEHWCNGSGGIAPGKGYSNSKYGPHTQYSEKKWNNDRYSSSTGYYIADGHTKCAKGCGSYYYIGTVTQYRYRTRTETTVYNYEKWTDYSSWSDETYNSSDTRRVKTQDVYRYQDLYTESNNSNVQHVPKEDNSGTKYDISGSLDNVSVNYSGKDATVMVYKDRNVDPSSIQIEYIGQIKLGANNSYDFSFIPKEEISVETGNYIVSFGIATADGLVNNVELIEAPLPFYTVTFVDVDGNIIDQQRVKHGCDATAPNVTENETYTISWERTFTNIVRDTTVRAERVNKKYPVIFVDWANNEIVKISEAEYGSKIAFPDETLVAEGKTFVGWSMPDDSIVEGTTIVEALYQDNQYVVRFMNNDGTVFAEQMVPHGQVAAFPEDNPTASGFDFICWSNDAAWWNVTSDIEIHPIFVFETTVETPTITAPTHYNVGSAEVELETSTEEAVIHFTVDGTEPTEDDSIFTFESIIVNETTVIKAKAFHPAMNESSTAEIVIEVLPDSDIPAVNAITNVSQYEIGDDYATICMKLDNPNKFKILSYGYSIYADTEYAFDYENTSIAGATDEVLGRAFTLNDLAPGEYTYSFFAEIENIGYITSESLNFTINDPEETFPDFEFEIDYDDNVAILKAYNGEADEIVIPSEFEGYPVTVIGDSAFRGCESIESVVIPDGVKVIDDSAFDYCTGLSHINIPNSIERIGYSAFSYTDLSDIELPDKPIEIGAYAFYQTNIYHDDNYWEDNLFYIGNHLLDTAWEYENNLVEIFVKNGTIDIASGICGEASDVERISIPKSVIKISESAFYSEGVLKNVYYGGTETDWNSIDIGDDNYSLSEATIHYNSGTLEHTHSYTSKITTPATCTKTGVKTYTCSCGDSYTESIKATGHKETTLKAVSATCTKTGLTAGKKCSVCGTITASQRVIAKTAHKEIAVAGKSATYTSTGLTAGKKCSVCGKITVAQKTIAKLTLSKVDGLKAKKVKVAKSSEITLAWNAVTGAKGYEIYQQNGSSWKKIKTTSGTSYAVKKLKSNKTYKFKVRAVVDGASGAYSSTLKVETIPATISKLTLKAGSKQLTATWKSVSDISGYEVQYSTSKKFTKKTTKTVKVKKSSKKTTIKKLKKGKKYYVRVRTYKTVNGKKIYSGWSTVKNVKVK